jgi:hypothetical protein
MLTRKSRENVLKMLKGLTSLRHLTVVYKVEPLSSMELGPGKWGEHSSSSRVLWWY